MNDTTKHIDSAKIILYLDTTILGPFVFPINGKVISHFGFRGSRMHTGTDIKLNRGDTVKAAFTGVVTKASEYYGYGKLVILKHANQLETYYAHLSKVLVKTGDTIRSGVPLGLGGRTGRATTEHLHFEIRHNSKALNPEHFFNFNENSINSLVLEQKTRTETERTTTKLADTKVKYHTIKKGDTLFALSRKYGTSLEEICRLNKMKKSTVLKIGRKIRVQ